MCFCFDLTWHIPAGLVCLKKRLIKDFGITTYDASILVEEKDYVDFYQKAADGNDGKLTANWMITELFGALRKENLSISQSPISSQNLGELVSLISNGTISGKIAKDVFVEMMRNKKSPSEIVKEKGLEQVSDDTAILKLINVTLTI